MSAIPVIAILDVGKTNKKLLLFDEDYKIQYENSVALDETVDEDGFACEDIAALTEWVIDSVHEISALNEFNVRAINFSAYGASFVHLDSNGKVIAPLYNYLKPYPDTLRSKFYGSYGGENNFTRITASPALGSLNSGLQLYRLKYERPEVFEKIKYSLHLPQYLSFLLTHKPVTDITSLGCHTGLWDFETHSYHQWVGRESIQQKLAPIVSSGEAVYPDLNDTKPVIGSGLHDTSAALIPFMKEFREPFVLLSTGTWNIALNPFNTSPLTTEELAKDCLCYLNYQGKAIKASRLFAGHAHERALERVAEHFNQSTEYHHSIHIDHEIINNLKTTLSPGSMKDLDPKDLIRREFFSHSLSDFSSFEEAYHQLVVDLVVYQRASLSLVLESPKTKRLFVSGGFSRNEIFMSLLAESFPAIEVYSASVSQASALGAAMAIHSHWNKMNLPKQIVNINRM